MPLRSAPPARLGAAALGCIAAVAVAPAGSARTITFDDMPVGQPPPRFLCAASGPAEAKPARWQVVAAADAPSPGRVLEQSDNDDANGRFPVAVLRDAQLADVSVAVAAKAVSGARDRSFGVVVRARDERTCYVARANSGGGACGPQEAARSWEAADESQSARWTPSGTMTYELISSYLTLALSPGDPRVQAAVDWLRRNYGFDANPGMGVGKEAQGLFHSCASGTAFGLLGLRTLTGDLEVDWPSDLFAALKQRAPYADLGGGRTGAWWSNSAARWAEGMPCLCTAYAIRALNAILAASQEPAHEPPGGGMRARREGGAGGVASWSGSGWRSPAMVHAGTVMTARPSAPSWRIAAGMLMAAWLSAAEVELPLPSNGATAALATAALMALRRGDCGPLAQLPGSAFTAPCAIADAGDDAVQRRWTRALPGILAGLDAGTRAQALGALDLLYRRAMAAAAESRPPLALAADFVPAPAAVAALAAGADRAFDQGAFADFLAMARLLSAAGGPPVMAERRQQVATLLSGLGPDVDAAMALAPPGRPEESAVGPPGEEPRLAVAWKHSAGWLLACDPWGGILWQHRIDRAASVVVGAGAALVNDSAGLRALTDAGTRIALGPAPAGARVLAFAGGAAWFATGSMAWRVELGSRRLQALELGGAALSPPLVRGAQSLWLTAQELLLFAGDRLQARMRHGLPAGPGWRLAADRSQPLVISAQGRVWRLGPLEEQLAHASASDRALLLLHAARFQEALAALDGAPEAGTPAGRSLLLRAHLGLGPAHALAARAAMLALAQDAQEEIEVLQAAQLAAAADPAEAASLHGLDERIADLARAHPDCLFMTQTLAPGAPPDLGAPPSAWAQGLSGAGYALAVEDRGSRIAGAARQLGATAEPAPLPHGQFVERRLADGSTRYRQRQLRLTARVERKEVRCEDDQGRLLWWHRWAGLTLLEAPSSSLTCRGDAVVVSEGQLRLHVISLFTGALLAQCALDDRLASLGDVAVLAAGRLALLGPLGVNTRLELTGAMPTVIELPAPARWLVGGGDQAWVALQDGRVLAYPGGAALRLPPAVAGLPSAPTAIARGLVAEDRLYPWIAP